MKLPSRAFLWLKVDKREVKWMTKQKKPPENRQPKRKCVNCDNHKATLQLNDYDWICEDCAQYMSDAGYEMSLSD
jgi:ribosomal protein L37AE/L43A